MDAAEDDSFDDYEPRRRRAQTQETVTVPVEERGEQPVSLVDGVLRVGSSYALAGVASFWTPYAPVAEARCVHSSAYNSSDEGAPRVLVSRTTLVACADSVCTLLRLLFAVAMAACSWARSCSGAPRPSTGCDLRRRCAASASSPARA